MLCYNSFYFVAFCHKITCNIYAWECTNGIIGVYPAHEELFANKNFQHVYILKILISENETLR